MFQFIETIKIVDGKPQNIIFHNNRFNHTQKIFFNFDSNTNLLDCIIIPNHFKKGLVKCRIVYSRDIDKIEFEFYTSRILSSLKLVESNEIDYSYKYVKRESINNLFLKRDHCDDILIIKNGFITDSSFANIVFTDNKNLITPSTPLLNGTKRQKLFGDFIISEDEIKIKDLKFFKNAYLINAMIELYEVKIDINNIY